MRSSRWQIRPVTGHVVIARPVRTVYDFCRDFSNLPRFLGDVVAVERVGSRQYRWFIQGPLDTRIPVTITVTTEWVDRLLRYRTSGPPLLQARWELSFTAIGGASGTWVRERLMIPFGAVGRAALATVGRSPQREVQANLTTLKTLLEASHGDGFGGAAVDAHGAREEAFWGGGSGGAQRSHRWSGPIR